MSDLLANLASPAALLALCSLAALVLALRGGGGAGGAGIDGARQTAAGDWLWRLPVMQAALDDPDLVLRLKRAGLRGRGRLRAFILLQWMMPVAAVIGGGLPLVLFPGEEQRSVARVVALLCCLALFAYALPSIYLQQRIRQRQEQFRRAWPDALDLLLLSVEAGLGLDTALSEVARRMEGRAPVLAQELQLTVAELAYLSDRRQAFSNLAARVDLPGVSIVSAALVQAERYGTPVGEALRAMARDSRASRMAEAERRAASLPPRLTVPMVVFFLPVLFAVIFTPAVIHYLTEQ